MYTLHNTVGGREALSTSILQREIELEGQYLANLFQKSAQDAAAVLEEAVQDVRDGLPDAVNFLGSEQPLPGSATASLPPNQQQRETLQATSGTATSQTNNINHGGNIDFSQLDPEHHHAIVIPYRDRKFHLEQFIEHMGPYLRRNFPRDTFELWIVEQDDQFLFNRAWLVNVGLANIKEQNRHHRYQELRVQQQAGQEGASKPVITVPPPPTCIVLHDVDLIPTVDGVPYTNCSRPIQLGTELAHFNYTIPYPLYTGGVGPSMTLEHWTKINGMSNDFFGKFNLVNTFG